MENRLHETSGVSCSLFSTVSAGVHKQKQQKVSLLCETKTPLFQYLTGLLCETKTPLFQYLTGLLCETKTPLFQYLMGLLCDTKTPLFQYLSHMTDALCN